MPDVAGFRAIGEPHAVFAETDHNGYRFEGCAVALLTHFGGGSAESHVLVTLRSPFQHGRAYVLESKGYLASNYVADKFGLEGADAGHLAGVLRLLTLLLPDRQIMPEVPE